MRISDWSSDVCSSDLHYVGGLVGAQYDGSVSQSYATGSVTGSVTGNITSVGGLVGLQDGGSSVSQSYATGSVTGSYQVGGLVGEQVGSSISLSYATGGSEEHTSELQSLMRNSYAVFR